MFPVIDTPEVKEGRAILLDQVSIMRSGGLDEKEIAHWVENKFSKQCGHSLMSLFDNTHHMASFTGIPVNCFEGFFMH
jgi:2-keto-3-deoxy-6-phosphogluconate aldolase